MKISTLLCFFLFFIISKNIAQPVITSFAPTFANVGYTMTINGSNFSSTPDSNIVRFGAVTATVSAASSTKLSVIVPLCATYGVITVSVNHLTAYSSTYFTPSMGCKSGYNTSFGSLTDSVFNYSTPFIARDFDGDGKVDMANIFDSHLNIKLNTSKPSLFSGAMIMQYNGVGSNAAYLTEGDLNGDGKLDILSANDDTISILKNESTTGNISFTKTSFITSFVAGNAVIADFDGDGKPDVIITDSNTNDSVFAVFRNIGNNGEIAFEKEQDFKTSFNGITNLVVADMDGDGKPDVIISTSWVQQIWVLKNTTKTHNVSFAVPSNISLVELGLSQIEQILIGDLDGDGKLDIVVGAVFVILGEGGGNSSNNMYIMIRNKSTKSAIVFENPSINSTSNIVGGNIALADINGDGKPDIVVHLNDYYTDSTGHSYHYNFIAIYLNTSIGADINFQQTNDVYNLTDENTSLQVADMDGDGMPDIVCGAQIFFGNCTLPLTLLNFSAKPTDNQVALQWYTATELNTSHFIIQHSTDGSSFTDIGTVKAIGSGANGYQFTDNNPINGINYYRLKSVDKDGGFSYSKVVSVQLTVNSNQLAVFPNPTKEKVTVRGNHIVSVQVVDNMGRVIKTQLLKDASNPTLSLTGMVAGVYHLRVQTTDGKVSGANLVVN